MKCNSKSGMTTVELMISVALVVVVIGISTSSWLALGRASSIAKVCSLMHAELRNGFDIMTKDITGADAVVDGSGNWFRLSTTRKGAATTVFYVFAEEKLWKVEGSGGNPIVLVNDIIDFDYTMYTDDGLTETLTHADAYSMDIVIRTERMVGSENFDDVYQARTMLRNKL